MGVSFYEITNKRRKRNFVFARMIYAYFCEKQGATVTEIAEEIKHNHSTVIYYLKKFKEEKQFNPKFRRIANSIEIALKTSETAQIQTQI
jgi:chromosomal replication initiation ATPase DnaA